MKRVEKNNSAFLGKWLKLGMGNVGPHPNHMKGNSLQNKAKNRQVETENRWGELSWWTWGSSVTFDIMVPTDFPKDLTAFIMFLIFC